MNDEKEVALAKDVHHETKKELLDESEISIILDSYDDIFSDFDPRTYAIREISDDFIQEAKKAMKVKAPGKVELKFLVPARQRSFPDEAIVKKRIKEYAKHMLEQTSKEIKIIKKQAGWMILIGALVGVAATLIDAYVISSILKSASLILLEPASWFLIWSGFDRFFFFTSAKQPDHEFYKRMNNMDISFTGY